MGIFDNRSAIESKLDHFIHNFMQKYEMLYKQKCPTMYKKLPFIKQGICGTIAYGRDAFLILIREPTLPPGQYLTATWDETEYPQLATASSIDAIVETIEAEEVLYCKKLDSLEPKALDETLGLKAAEQLAETLLEENMRTAQPTLEDAADRMKQAYELLFLLENNLRQLIEQELKKAFGEGDWWEKGATHRAKVQSDRNQQDPRWKWHEPMKASPLNYVEFETLHDIIANKNLEIFKEILGPQATFSANFKNLEVPRNLIAHNNVLAQQEFYNFRRNTETLLRIIKPHLQ